MTELGGLYAIWEREVLVYFRERSRVVSAVINPLLWLVIYGTGIGSQISVPGTSYQTYIFPGVIVMTLIFSSIFYGASIVWDKKIDFLKEALEQALDGGIGLPLGVLGGGGTASGKLLLHLALHALPLAP